MGSHPKTAVLVPLKPFARAKTRLEPAFSPQQRQQLARSLAENVLHSARGIRTAIVGPPDAQDIARFALINGARFIAGPGAGDINHIIAHAVRELRERDYERVLVIKSDLPLVKDLRWLATGDEITMVSDSFGTGTNAIYMPTHLGFPFSLIGNTFATNQQIAERHNLEVKAIVDPDGASANVATIEDAIRIGALTHGDQPTALA